MNKPEQEKIDKLPRWVKSYIFDLEQRNKGLIEETKKFVTDQEKSAFYSSDLVRLEGGFENVKRYLKVDRELTVEHEGVVVQIMLPSGVQGRRGIELSWHTESSYTGYVAMQPYSHQAIRLMTAEMFNK